MTDYERKVTRLFKEQSDEIIACGVDDSSAIFHSLMFDNAKTKIRILTNNLPTSVFGRASVVASAKRALDRQVKFEIVYTETPEYSDFVKMLFGYLAKNNGLIEVYRLSEPLINTNHDSVYFTVMDECGFRYEDNNKELKAFASANKPDYILEFVGFFDNAVKQAKLGEVKNE